jgi:hypothetical protein
VDTPPVHTKIQRRIAVRVFPYDAAARPAGVRVAGMLARCIHHLEWRCDVDTNLPVSFGSDIKALFREQDRESMMMSFDLWSYDDVKEFATRILDRLQDGTMPCDGAWPEEDVSRFAAWIDGGMQP